MKKENKEEILTEKEGSHNKNHLTGFAVISVKTFREIVKIDSLGIDQFFRRFDLLLYSIGKRSNLGGMKLS